MRLALLVVVVAASCGRPCPCFLLSGACGAGDTAVECGGSGRDCVSCRAGYVCTNNQCTSASAGGYVPSGGGSAAGGGTATGGGLSAGGGSAGGGVAIGGGAATGGGAAAPTYLTVKWDEASCCTGVCQCAGCTMTACAQTVTIDPVTLATYRTSRFATCVVRQIATDGWLADCTGLCSVRNSTCNPNGNPRPDVQAVCPAWVFLRPGCTYIP